MSSDTPALIIPGNGKANEALERHLSAKAIADSIMNEPSGSEGRWNRIRFVWYHTDVYAKQDHADAVYAAAQARKDMEDKEYGTTRATRGVAHGEDANGHIRSSMIAIMPERLKAWLVKYDPYLNARVNKGAKQQREAWRRVYKLFPEYRTTTKQGSW